MRVSTVIASATIVLGSLTGAFFIGRRSVQTAEMISPPRLDAASTAEGDERNPPVAPQRLSWPIVPKTSLDPDRDAEKRAAEAAQAARRQRAAYLLGLVFERIDQQARRRDETPPEGQANAVKPFLLGMLEGSVQADPQMRAAFSEELTESLCRGGLSEGGTIALSHMAAAYPDLATTRGFDCYFASAKEDNALWSMLDAWRVTGLEGTPALAQLQARATDPRTTRRFLSPEQQRAQRVPREVLDEP